jgi:hyaluronan synthase/N-acetylglucosaminyltransferase
VHDLVTSVAEATLFGLPLVYLYGVLALTHLAIQWTFAHLEYRRQCRQRGRRLAAAELPRVTVVVPVYNEEAEPLYKNLSSLYHEAYEPLEILVVDDGSENIAEHEPVYRQFENGRLRVFRLPENRGKRHAQKYAFDRATGEIIVTVDSDTHLHSELAIGQIVQRFADPRVGAVTGHVKVENKRRNLLTRLIALRYWMAFNQERAAQSFWGVMLCCSGPFAAYRRHLIDAVKDDYVRQQFLGQECTFGDDRHLTNLVLGRGYDVVYDHFAMAYTYVPERLRAYWRQQLRWNKSFYREFLWTLRFAHRRNLYLGWELGFQACMPFLLLGALALMVLRTVYIEPNAAWKYGLILFGIGLVRSLYGAVRTRRLGFFGFVGYGVVHLWLILCRLTALFTLRRQHWGSREARPADLQPTEPL